jgi:hypothetical protein
LRKLGQDWAPNIALEEYKIALVCGFHQRPRRL